MNILNKKENLFILDNTLSMGAYWVCSGTIVAAMTNYFDIPLSIANFLTSITATFTLLQMPGALLFSKFKNKMTYLYFVNLVWRLILPVVFFSVLLTQGIGSGVFVVAIVLLVSFMHLAAPAQTAWTVSGVQGRAGPSFYAVREMSFMFFHITLFCISASIINFAQNGNFEQNGFIIIGTILGVVLLLSIAVLFKLPRFSEEAQTPNNSDNTQNASNEKTSKLMLTVFKNKAFLAVLITNALWSFSNMFVGSFAGVYQVRMLQLPFLDILIWTTVGGISRGVVAPLLQRLAMKISWQRVVQLSILVMATGGVGWFFITPENKNLLYPVLSILGAVPFAGLSVGFLQMQVDGMGKSANRTVYFSTSATVNGVMSLLGSLICSTTIGYIDATSSNSTSDLRIIFIIGIVFMAVTIIVAQGIGQHKNIRANKLKTAIANAREKYPNAIGAPLPKEKQHVVILRKIKNKFKR